MENPLIKHLKRRGWVQRTLAAAADMDAAVVSKFLHGKTFLQPDALHKLELAVEHDATVEDMMEWQLEAVWRPRVSKRRRSA